jgi:hypothetical protein
MRKLLLLVTLMFSSVLFSSGDHDHGHDHDHDAPGAVAAQKGGIIKSLEEVHVEVVAKGVNVKIYFFTKDLKPLDVSKLKVTAEAELPRSKKKEAVSLVSKGTWYETSFDAKGMHRYTLVLTINDPKQGHNDKLNFTIEKK